MGHSLSEMSLDRELTAREKKCEKLRGEVKALPLSMLTIDDLDRLEEFRRRIKGGGRLSGKHWSERWTNESISFWKKKT